MDADESQAGGATSRPSPAGAAILVTSEEAMAWLHAYKHAWQERDVDAALALFTDDASYRERRFGEPLLGHKTLESYWRDRVFEHQRDIAFDFQLWGVKGNELMARWQASFIWLPINGLMRMDGVMHVTFAGRRNGRLIGSDYSEWFDHTEK